MKYVVSFFVILLTVFYINIARSESLIVYINMEMIMNKTNAGKSISQKLEKMHKANIAEFKKIEDKLREEEASILSQKNILSEADYSKKVNLMNNKIDQYKKNRQEKINLVTKKKIDATHKLLKELNPILLDYSKENGISIILQKKNIVLARTDLDITDKIIEIANTKIKKIDLN